MLRKFYRSAEYKQKLATMNRERREKRDAADGIEGIRPKGEGSDGIQIVHNPNT